MPEKRWAEASTLEERDFHLNNKFLAHSCNEGELSITEKGAENTLCCVDWWGNTLVGALIRHAHGGYGQSLGRKGAGCTSTAHEAQRK